MFKKLTYFRSLFAVILYNKHEIDKSKEVFEDLMEEDQYNIGNLGVYSDILYVNGEQAKLSILAHELVKIEKFSPETCHVLGNYYSCKGMSDKAIFYFKRALVLDPKRLSIWVLLGHEYTELKERALAIECYRKGAQSNDYRAWYGLGEAYELLSMYQYALYYYKKACLVRPYDSRMWSALAVCYEKSGHILEAVKCYEKAEAYTDIEGKAAIKLAQLYQQLGNEDKAALYYAKHIEKNQDEDVYIFIIS